MASGRSGLPRPWVWCSCVFSWTTSYRGRGLVPPPSLISHVPLDHLPDALDDLAVPPAASVDAVGGVLPAVDADVRDAVAPGDDTLGGPLAAPADVYAGDVAEELVRVTPLVTLELPALAGGEDGDDAVPVLGLELLRALDQDEAHRPRRVDVLEQSVDVQHARARRARRRRVRWHVLPALKEGFYVGHAQQRRCGGGEQNDGIGPLRLLVTRDRGVRNIRRRELVRFLRHKHGCIFPNVRKILRYDYWRLRTNWV